MARIGGQKLKLLRLYDILMKYSDEDNLLSRSDIEKHLLAYGITVDKKTFYADLMDLEEYTDTELIRKHQGHDYRYGVPEEMRKFSLAELKLLVDSVLSARFLTEGQSYGFIRKLESLCSDNAAKQLRRQIVLANRTRTEQTEVFSSVDVLNKAIDEDRQVRFHYFSWNVRGEREYRHNGDFYKVSPWALTWDDGKYYLIGEDMIARDGRIRHYRVDKMEDVSLSEDCRAFSEVFDGLSKSEYSNELFWMFGGETQKIDLVCENSMANVILDRFGKDQMLHYEDREHFRTHVNVVDSNQFYAWIISLGGGVRIDGPEKAVLKMQSITQNLIKIYGRGNSEV